MTEVFLGRQPILDSAKQLFAYELLFRAGHDESAAFASGDQASAAVVLNAFIEIGLENVVQNHRAFVKMTRRFLLEELYRPLPNSRIVLSLTREIEPDDDVLRAVQDAARRGYRILLGGYRHRPEMEPLLALADYVGLDLGEAGVEGVKEQVAALRGRHKTLIANRVETNEQFEQLRRLGLKYFKGYFFCRPDVVSHRTVPANKLAVIQLLSKIRNPNVKLGEIQELIERNVALAYRILRCVNSALYSFPRRIESIRHAIALLGLERIRDCLSLSLLADADDKPHELTVLGLVRARMCQLLARASGSHREEVFFSAGLLSVLDAILDTPMEKVVEMIAPAAELKEALLERAGPAGEALNAAICCEQESTELRPVRVFGAKALRESYLAAIRWVHELDRSMQEQDAQPVPGGAEPVPDRV